MKKILFTLLFIFPFYLMSEEGTTHYYIGEMKYTMPEDQEPEHYGLFFLKRTLLPEENRFIDKCFISALDGDTLELLQVSDLKGDLHEIVLSSPTGLITGSGELIGFPWEWTSLHEHMEIKSDSSVHIDVQNTWEDNYILSVASVYTLDDLGGREFFATFSATLFRVDKVVIEHFFEDEP
ncbi:MAG: hypothetical protein KDK69_01075 [Chlamydiia bacterium]|nr:hypothetical protein [Chlamydiia bacterium]